MREGSSRAGTGTNTRVIAVSVRAWRPAAADVPTSTPAVCYSSAVVVVVVVVAAAVLMVVVMNDVGG